MSTGRKTAWRFTRLAVVGWVRACSSWLNGSKVTYQVLTQVLGLGGVGKISIVHPDKICLELDHWTTGAQGDDLPERKSRRPFWGSTLNWGL